jgi:hypothetical protein
MDARETDRTVYEASATGNGRAKRYTRAMRFTSSTRQRGTAIVETVIALPILLVVIFGIIQFALIYEAKATLNHAALQAARAGAVEHAQPEAIRSGLARGLAPLYSPDSSLQGYAATLARIEGELLRDARIRILNPTREAFTDFSEDVDGIREIPNDRLHARSTAIGPQSGLNIQDANLLRVQITYGYDLKVPIVNWFITRTLLALTGAQTYDRFERELLRRTLLPIIATSTVRMHSPARLSDLVVSRADLPTVPRFAADAAPPDGQDNDDEESEEEEPHEDPDEQGSTLADGFFGFGSGSANASPSQDPGEGSGNPGADDDWTVGGGGPRDCPVNMCCLPPRPPL